MDAIQDRPYSADQRDPGQIVQGRDVEQGRARVDVTPTPLGHVGHEVQQVADLWEMQRVGPCHELVEANWLPASTLSSTVTDRESGFYEF